MHSRRSVVHSVVGPQGGVPKSPRCFRYEPACGRTHMFSHWMPLAAVLSFLLFATGCASGSGGGSLAKEPMNLDITVSAAARVNLDAQGRPAPLQVRIYELRTPAAFEAADYFSLANSDKSVLQTDLLSRQDYLLRPGETQRLQRRAHPEVTAIGVLAGYRELESSNWRTSHPLPEAPDTSWMRAVIRESVQAATLGGGERLGWSSWLGDNNTRSSEPLTGMVFEPEAYLDHRKRSQV